MSLDDDFTAAQARVKTLPKTPGADQLLALYSLFKQGTQGDVTGSRPGALNFKERAKYDAWHGRKGMAQDEAKRAYIELVQSLFDQA